MAVVKAGGYSFNSTPSLGASICRRCGPKKTKKKKRSQPLADRILKVVFYIFFFLVFCLFRAAPAANGDSQARWLIGAVAAGLLRNHSNVGPVSVTYTTDHSSGGSLTH